MATEAEEIWQHATGEQTENAPETPVEAPSEPQTDRTRDDKGRFAKPAPEPTSQEEPVAEQEHTQPEVEKEDARIPSWRLKEESDRRREAEQQLNEMRLQMQMLMAQRQQQQLPPQPQEEIDIFAQPEQFVNKIQNQLQEQVKLMRLESSLDRAALRHGEDVFSESYNAFVDHYHRTRDEASRQRVMASSNPGEALVQWYKEQKLHQELGGADLQTFLERQREEWLKDPSVQAKVIEAFKATQQAQAPSNLTQLPPSLSRASAARSAHDDGGSSPQDIWAYATKR